MTASEKWLMLTALERYIEDMQKAERKAEEGGWEAISKRFHDNADDAIALKRKISMGEVNL